MKLLLLAGVSALRAVPRRMHVSRRATTTMKWGENIGDDTFLRNPDGRPSQLTRDYGKLVITRAAGASRGAVAAATRASIARDRGRTSLQRRRGLSATRPRPRECSDAVATREQ